MAWTKEQQLAIDTRDKNILVSAAAGSGKTTVLVARIKKLVIEEGADIGKFLITTYTKAAAAEMKERLEKAIRDEMLKPDSDKVMLTKQLSKLPGANISTFHSFAIEIIRQYFYLTDLEPGFTVADDVQAAIISKKALDTVFENRYESDASEFKEFILKYSSSRGDNQLKDNIIDTYNTLTSIPDYISQAYAKAEMLNSESPLEEIQGFTLIAEMVADELKSAKKWFEKAANFADNQGIDSAFDASSQAVDELELMLTAMPQADGLTQAELKEKLVEYGGILDAFKVNRMSWKDVDPDVKKILTEKILQKGKDAVKAAKEWCSEDFGVLDQQLKDMYGDTKYYVGLVEEFDNLFKAMKREENIVDFNDLMHYSIEVLKNDDVAGELREKFDYIFVDEYQDSNYLQEEIVGRIARSNNLFLVGDVKQCIYKFRLAEPELFVGKAQLYGKEEETESMLLNINCNFRSKANVTEPVNDLFRKVMPGYDSNAELNCTAPAEYPGFPARIHIINREDFDENSPEKSDAEAEIAAQIIREKLGQEVYDTKAGKTRKLTLRDFVVLARNNGVVEDVERYLINEGIPAYGEGSGQYFETVEVQVFLNLLRIINNMRQDVPLISAMKSVVFGFTVPELAEIRTAFGDDTYYSAVKNYAESGDDEVLREKIKAMMDQIALWKEISRTVPLEELMKVILYDTGYYDYCSGLPVGVQRISNLRLIADKAARYEEISHGGLHGFLNYIESMRNAGKNDSEAKVIGENEDVVRVMTVHKSKGLEFPVVIFANAAKGTKPRGHSVSIKIHTDYGIGLPIINRQEHWKKKTFLQKAIDIVKEKEALEEEIRVLYVALTRAKDGLEIIGTVKNSDGMPEDVSIDSFLNMIYMPFADRSEVDVRIYDAPQALEAAHSMKMHTPEELMSKAAGVTDDDVAERLEYEYPYKDAAGVKPKYSVTELNYKASKPAGEGGTAVKVIKLAELGESEAVVGLDEDGSFVSTDIDIKETWDTAEPAPVEEKGLTAAERGTVMHLLMEKLDFAAAAEQGKEYIRTVADELLAAETINDEQRRAISINKAASFFESEVGRRAAAAWVAGTLRREKEFILSKEINGENAVVQGIIDCYFEEPGDEDQPAGVGGGATAGLVLIDYKSNYVGPGQTEQDLAAMYKDQVRLYKEALEGATGKPVKEAYLFLFSTGTFVSVE